LEQASEKDFPGGLFWRVGFLLDSIEAIGTREDDIDEAALNNCAAALALLSESETVCSIAA